MRGDEPSPSQAGAFSHLHNIALGGAGAIDRVDDLLRSTMDALDGDTIQRILENTDQRRRA